MRFVIAGTIEERILKLQVCKSHSSVATDSPQLLRDKSGQCDKAYWQWEQAERITLLAARHLVLNG